MSAWENIGVFATNHDLILEASSKEKGPLTGTITVLSLLASKLAALLAHSNTKLYLFKMLKNFMADPTSSAQARVTPSMGVSTSCDIAFKKGLKHNTKNKPEGGST